MIMTDWLLEIQDVSQYTLWVASLAAPLDNGDLSFGPSRTAPAIWSGMCWIAILSYKGDEVCRFDPDRVGANRVCTSPGDLAHLSAFGVDSYELPAATPWRTKGGSVPHATLKHVHSPLAIVYGASPAKAADIQEWGSIDPRISPLLADPKVSNSRGCECGTWSTGGRCSSWCPARIGY